MKNTIFLFSLLALGSWFFVSCSTSKKAASESAAQDLVEWNKMVDAYHAVMSTSFHPAEEGDLAPLKKQASLLAQRATDWASIPLSPALEAKGAPQQLKKLVEGSQGIARLVAEGADDPTLTKAITDLHDVFHLLAEMGSGH
ncbi:MAG: hypothetical protein ACKOAY_12540 [Haliscomenobacter sp.]